jgi:AraC family transcriptional regulator
MEKQLPTLDLLKEDGLAEALPMKSSLSSYASGWQGIQLDFHRSPPFELPEYTCQQHIITIPTIHGMKVERIAEGKSHNLTFYPGDFCFSPQELSLQTRWEQDLEAIHLILEPALIAQVAHELVDPDRVALPHHVKTSDPLIYHLGIALKQSLEDFGEDSKLYADTATTFLAMHLLKHYAIHKPRCPNYSEGLPTAQLRQVNDYIYAHIDEEICLDTLSSLLGLSRYYFCRLFKQSTGFSPYQYIIRCRVERAKILLKQGKLSLSEVALTCGFSHQSHLHRHFKRLTGSTPKSFVNS